MGYCAAEALLCSVWEPQIAQCQSARTHRCQSKKLYKDFCALNKHPAVCHCWEGVWYSWNASLIHQIVSENPLHKESSSNGQAG